jgi:uncharacterized protein YprB with RNaseH-like and TPR domain
VQRRPYRFVARARMCRSRLDSSVARCAQLLLYQCRRLQLHRQLQAPHRY